MSWTLFRGVPLQAAYMGIGMHFLQIIQGYHLPS